MGHSKLESFRLFPCERLIAEVTISRRLSVDGVNEVKLFDNDARSQIEVCSNDFLKFWSALLARAIALNEDRQGFSDTNRVGELYEASTSELSCHEGLCHPACEVCR